MPNHVTNILIIGGVSDERLAVIKEVIASCDTNVEKGETPMVQAIDFNKIIPMPKELRITDSSRSEQGLARLHPELVNTSFYKGEEGERRWNQMTKKNQQEALKGGRQYYKNIKKFGYATWYPWAYNNWGTKWNAYIIEDRGNEIQFDTAWSTPYPVIEKLSEMFPDATFSVTYADEDIGQNCGRYTLENGEQIEDYQPDSGSDEAYELAIEIKGLQGELVKNESTGEWEWKED